MMEQNNLKPAYIFSVLIAVLATIVSLGGLLLDGLYRDNAFVKTTWLGNASYCSRIIMRVKNHDNPLLPLNSGRMSQVASTGCSGVIEPARGNCTQFTRNGIRG